MALTPERKRQLTTAALVAPAGLWLFVFLVLPFMAMVVFAFGERAPEGGYRAAFTFAQFVNLPSRAGRVLEHPDDRAGRCLSLPDRCLSRRLLSGDQIQSEIPARARLSVGRSLLDKPARAHLCLDVYPWLARHPQSAWHDRHRGCTLAQHARRRAARASFMATCR